VSLTITTGIGDKPRRVALKCGSVIEIQVVKQGIGLAAFQLEDLTKGCDHHVVEHLVENGITTGFKCSICGKVFQ